jgi:hypothetical protein
VWLLAISGKRLRPISFIIATVEHEAIRSSQQDLERPGNCVPAGPLLPATEHSSSTLIRKENVHEENDYCLRRARACNTYRFGRRCQRQLGKGLWEMPRSLKDDQAFKAVKEGIKDSEGKIKMKPAENLTDDEIKALVGLVRTLK